MAKKYVVTGAAGFVASHIAQTLLNHGHKVIGVDDFSSGLKRNLPEHENFTLAVADLANEDDMRRISHHFEGAEGVFHLAADARIQPSITYPRHNVQNNVQATLNILEGMRYRNVKKIVYSGSSSVYGRINKPPYIESAPTDPLNAYAASKLMGETLCQAWDRSYGIEHVVLRYFNVFGPRSPTHIGAYSPVVGLFFQQALKGERLTVVGDGLQTRDFTWVDDVVTANLKAMQTKLPQDMRLLNVGTGSEISILDLAMKINELCGQPKANIDFVPARPGEATQTRAQNYLSAYRLGVDYTPLDEALKKLKPYYENDSDQQTA